MKFEVIVANTVKTYTSYTEARKEFYAFRRERPNMRAIDEQGNIMIYNSEQGAFFPVYNKK